VALGVKVAVGAAAYLAVARVLSPAELRAALGRRAS
jgi:hypothetical protein